VGSNPTSTATDQARYATLVAALCLPGKLLSQFLATKRPLCQVRERFLPLGRAVSAHTARALAVAEAPAHPSPMPSQSVVGTLAADARVAAMHASLGLPGCR
jgi:hypothetical protein